MARTAMQLSHGVWALLCGGVSVFLALIGGGHPPPIVLVPLVLIVWAIGHLGLWLMVVLVRRGRGASPAGAAWPPGVVVALAGLAAITAMTLLQVVVTALTGKLYPYRGSLWFVMAGAGTLHAASLIGVLLRRNWGRVMAVLVCFGWSALMVKQLVDHLSHGRPISAGEGTLAFVLLAAPAALGLHLLSSPRVRAYFARD